MVYTTDYEHANKAQGNYTRIQISCTKPEYTYKFTAIPELAPAEDMVQGWKYGEIGRVSFLTNYFIKLNKLGQEAAIRLINSVLSPFVKEKLREEGTNIFTSENWHALLVCWEPADEEQVDTIQKLLEVHSYNFCHRYGTAIWLNEALEAKGFPLVTEWQLAPKKKKASRKEKK